MISSYYDVKCNDVSPGVLVRFPEPATDPFFPDGQDVTGYFVSGEFGKKGEKGFEEGTSEGRSQGIVFFTSAENLLPFPLVSKALTAK